MRTLVLVFALVCGSCMVSHAQVYRNPYIKTGIYGLFYSHYRYPQPYTQQLSRTSNPGPTPGHTPGRREDTSMKTQINGPNEMLPEGKIRELEEAENLSIQNAQDARAKLAAKYWARIGRLLNQIQQRPTKKAIDEARDVLERFRQIPDMPFVLDKQIDALKEYLLGVESNCSRQ